MISNRGRIKQSLQTKFDTFLQKEKEIFCTVDSLITNSGNPLGGRGMVHSWRPLSQEIQDTSPLDLMHVSASMLPLLKHLFNQPMLNTLRGEEGKHIASRKCIAMISPSSFLTDIRASPW